MERGRYYKANFLLLVVNRSKDVLSIVRQALVNTQSKHKTIAIEYFLTEMPTKDTTTASIGRQPGPLLCFKTVSSCNVLLIGLERLRTYRISDKNLLYKVGGMGVDQYQLLYILEDRDRIIKR